MRFAPLRLPIIEGLGGKSKDLELKELHDASLAAIRFDWATRTCHFDFSGSPKSDVPFSLVFNAVAELVLPAAFPWGPSVSVLEAKVSGIGRYEIEMQSGDTITVVAPNHSFKPTR